MSPELVLSIKIYVLAAAISMAVAAVIKLIGLFMAKRVARPIAQAPAPASDDEGLDDSVVAAISAAISTVIGSHRIVHIAERAQGRAWATEGRSAHHGSHNVSRRGPQAVPPKSRR